MLLSDDFTVLAVAYIDTFIIQSGEMKITVKGANNAVTMKRACLTFLSGGARTIDETLLHVI